MKERSPIPQAPIDPAMDLRMMLRNHIVGRSLECMAEAGRRREAAIDSGEVGAYGRTVRSLLGRSHRDLPVGSAVPPPDSRTVSVHRKKGYRIENVLFDSFPGWQVNASVYVPEDFEPPFPGIVVPVGHSGKQFASYQLPCQFFARSGFLTITFDPPGQAGEKQAGNDHFRDGVRPYLTGDSSSRYFVADALRCIDYLYTRSDADLRPGVAMTGVSGGGTTTMMAGLLDDRVSVLGPSCCLSPLADLAIRQCYAGCPEGRMWRRYADGLDYVDILCAAAPKPVLIMAGRADEVFRLEDTVELVGMVRRFYQSAGAADLVEFFIDESGHAYTLDQAARFVDFLDRRFLDRPPPRPKLPMEGFALNPVAELQCHPRQDVNMRTLTRDRAVELRRSREIHSLDTGEAATRLAGWTDGFREAVRARVGEPFQAWVHQIRQVSLQTEPDIMVPGTLITPMTQRVSPFLLHFDDGGRDRLLEGGGILGRAIRFLDRDGPTCGCLAVDLRGWGDSEPAMLPYEIPGWASRERFFAYSSFALGDSTMGMRIRDGLAALDFLRNRPESAGAPIIATGCGLGGLIAAHVAAIDAHLAGVVIWNCLRAFEDLLEAEDCAWSPEVFIPGVLEHYEVADLLTAAGCPVRWINPLDAMKNTFGGEELEAMEQHMGTAVRIENGEDTAILAALAGLLDKADG
ncbi:MAG: hypothetical protein R3F07_12670 [Opitutaceae bacterium]